MSRILFAPMYKNTFNASTLYKKFVSNFCTSKSDFQIHFKYGVTVLPHMHKRSKGGEDAYTANENLICVADGVGGWNEIGVDPALYSNELVSNISKEYLKSKGSKLLDIFINACKNTKSRGSSTCSICKIHSNTQIETLNLGDSGYLILRPTGGENLEIIFKSQEQTKGFNFPYQVGEHGDDPREADIMYHEVKNKDIIILATDGLWDNMNEDQIKLITKRSLTSSNDIDSCEKLSKTITYTAESLSLDESYLSPFSRRSEGLFRGGKHDDITVIVAQIEHLDLNPKF